jgi:hypothetical protein
MASKQLSLCPVAQTLVLMLKMFQANAVITTGRAQSCSGWQGVQVRILARAKVPRSTYII